MNDDIKKRMYELENQLKIQNENLNKISNLANKKEEKLNNDISNYLKQINDLKNELEQLNNTITNLTEEKENNTIKLTELMRENEQLRKNKNYGINNHNNIDDNNEIQNTKYEELIIKLKKNIMKLTEEKKSLEEVIIKQEEKVSELSLKVDNVKKEIIIKDKELRESIEYNEKLTNTINLHKKELQKLKQNNNNNINNNINNNNNNNNKDVMNIMNLQKEIQNIKKEIETKDNKINLLSMNNKILQGKVNKLSQTTKTGFNNELKSLNFNNYKDLKISLINPKMNDNKTFHRDKNKLFIIAKPKKVNGRQNSTSLRMKNEFYKYNEDNMGSNNNNNDVIAIANKDKYTNLQQMKNTQKRNNSNINNIKRQNIDINNNNDNNNKIVDIKYKEIESKYNKEINKEMKDDTLFDDDVVNNFDIREELVNDNNVDQPIVVLSNMASQTLIPKKKKQYNVSGDDRSSMNISQEKNFHIIESYCLLSTNKDEKDDAYNIKENINNDAFIKNYSKVENENNQVQELHNHVKKILDEFN